ncbi:MAG: hypothetical protein IAX21_03580 [Candidatus Bathyarchaeota archaeon]|nr:MAG: hypothetical protein IAX21_03580 [Candidatus Bathyarchaeota archaeon]
MPTGFNWRNNLSQFASISGVLAGFSVTFIALILGGINKDISLCSYFGLSYTTIAVLCFGIASVLFISAAEYFLKASEFDCFSIPDRYIDLHKDDCKMKEKEFEEWEDEQTKKCRENEVVGRRCYNVALVLLFGGLFYSIFPFTYFAGVVIFILGIFFQFREEIMGKKNKVISYFGKKDV